MIGRLWRALTHPLDVPVLRAALADAGPDEPRTGIIEVRLRASDGSWVWVEGQATLRFRGGSAIAVEIIGRDVTRTRAAEDEGRRLAEQLKALVAGAPYGILMLDQTGHIAVVNEQACSLLDLSRAPRGADRPRVRADPDRDASACSPSPEPGDRAAARDRRVRRDRALRAPSTAPTAAASATTTCRSATRRRRALWTFRDITHFKLPERGAAAVPGDDEPRDQDAAVRASRARPSCCAAPGCRSASASSRR